MSEDRQAGDPPPPPDTMNVLPETLALLSAVLSNAPFGFALLDAELRYLHVNEALAALNQRSPEDHRGLRPVDISPVLDTLVGPLLREVLDTAAPVEAREFRVAPPTDEQPRDFLLSAYPVIVDGTLMGLAVAVIDITSRRRTMDRLEAQARQLTAVVQLGMAALGGQAVRKLVTDAAATVREVLGVDRVGLLRSDAGGEFVLETVAPADARPTPAVVVRRGDGSLAGETLASGEPLVVRDAASDPRFDRTPVAGDLEVCSAAAVLIPGVEDPFGVLAVYSAQQRDVSDDEVRFIQAVANVIGTAVQRRRTERALEASDTRLRMAQEAGRMGVWEWDLRGNVIIWSDALEHLWGLPTGGFDGRFETFREMVHPDDRERVEAAVTASIDVTGSYELEHRILRADTGELRWLVARGDTIRDDAGTAIRMIGINVDITERKLVEEERFSLLRAEQTARAAAERSRERLTFLSDATGALSASLDYHETLQALTRLAVPEHADICIVDLLEGGKLTTVAVAHADPATEDLVWELRRRYPAATAADDPTRETLRYAQPLLFTEMPDEVLESMAVDGEHLDLLHRLAVCSGIVVPLIARGRVLGTLSLLRTADREPFEGVDDQTLVMELGRRAALAIDNARLYADAEQTGQRFRRMAETLQASLLPPNLPVIPGVDVAAIYRAAAAGTTVGGDFYDVFARTDRGWGIVIGDVQGKGTEAATVTGIARHTIRTAAMRRNPAGSLHMLNEALLQGEEHDNRFCTVLFGQLESAEDRVHVELASGGHPPALVRRADGSVDAVGGGGTLMGVIENISIQVAAVELHPGDAMVLYTDGVLEARGPSGEFGEQRLATVLSGTPAANAEGVASAIEDAVTRFSAGELRDDIAILVVRAETADEGVRAASATTG